MGCGTRINWVMRNTGMTRASRASATNKVWVNGCTVLLLLYGNRYYIAEDLMQAHTMDTEGLKLTRVVT
jgi:hypothetical protein